LRNEAQKISFEMTEPSKEEIELWWKHPNWYLANDAWNKIQKWQDSKSGNDRPDPISIVLAAIEKVDALWRERFQRAVKEYAEKS
jgi:hypothetical protein